MKRIFVSYVFAGGAERTDSQVNLHFFLTHGVTSPKNDKLEVDYAIVSNGMCTVDECNHPEKFLNPNEDGKVPKVRTLHRDNIGFDLGGHTAMLEELDEEGKMDDDYYDAFIFLNDGVIGPFFPSYMPSEWHWSNAFIDKFTDKSHRRGETGLVGTTVMCMPKLKQYPGIEGPKIESFAFAMTPHALNVARTFGTTFTQHRTKNKAIFDGENRLAQVVLEHGINIDCLLNSYRDVDWRNENECNDMEYASRAHGYFGISIDPMEVVFHKPHWKGQEPVNENIVNVYGNFLNEALKRRKGERIALQRKDLIRPWYPIQRKIRAKHVLSFIGGFIFLYIIIKYIIRRYGYKIVTKNNLKSDV